MAGSQFNRNTTETKSKESRSTAMSTALIDIILSYTGNDEIGGAAVTPLVSTLFNSIKDTKMRRLRPLLTAIVDGKPNEVKIILDNDPSLVFEKLEEKEFVTSLSEHKFNLKPYQAALAVDDTQMQALVKSYFEDKDEADRQMREQENPSKDIIKAENKKWQCIFEQLNTLVSAIAGSTIQEVIYIEESKETYESDITSSGAPDYDVVVKRGSLVERELLVFWKLLDATKDDVITAGKKPFNPDLFLKAWNLFKDQKHFKKYFGDNWVTPRAVLFWQKVIGYEGIQRIMPVNYIQAFCDGIGNTINKLQEAKPQGRSTQFPVAFHEVIIDYPIKERGTRGYDFVISREAVYSCDFATENEFNDFVYLIVSKIIERNKLMPQHQEKQSESLGCCVMM